MFSKRVTIGRSISGVRNLKRFRTSESDEQRTVRIETDRLRVTRSQRTVHVNLYIGAFKLINNYDTELNFRFCIIHHMNLLCCHRFRAIQPIRSTFYNTFVNTFGRFKCHLLELIKYFRTLTIYQLSKFKGKYIIT